MTFALLVPSVCGRSFAGYSSTNAPPVRPSVLSGSGIRACRVGACWWRALFNFRFSFDAAEPHPLDLLQLPLFLLRGRRYRLRGFDSQASRFPFVNMIHSVAGLPSENNRNLTTVTAPSKYIYFIRNTRREGNCLIDLPGGISVSKRKEGSKNLSVYMCKGLRCGQMA